MEGIERLHDLINYSGCMDEPIVDLDAPRTTGRIVRSS